VFGVFWRHLQLRRGETGRGFRAVALAPAGCAAALLLVGCGLIGSSGTSSSASSGSGSTEAYFNCLRSHGVKIPASRPTAAPSGGFGGFGGGSSGADSTFQKARQACASLRPSGGFGGFGGGGFGGGFAEAFQAFRSCMSSHGEPIPTTRPTAPPSSGSGTDRFLNGLNPDNAKVAAALKACESKLPSFASNG
jgi:hypothetical protein